MPSSLYRALNEESIYTLKLKKRGISYQAWQDMDLMASIKVREALTQWFPIVNESGELLGIVTAQSVTPCCSAGKPREDHWDHLPATCHLCLWIHPPGFGG